MEKEEFIRIADKIIQGTASDEEIAKYNYYYRYFQENTEWNYSTMGDMHEVANDLEHRIESSINIEKGTNFKQWLSIAATFTILFSAVAYFYLSTPDKDNSTHTILTNDLSPGSDKAVLTLTDGSKILLEELDRGKTIKQTGVNLSNSEKGLLTYEYAQPNITSNINDLEYNSISIPRGGEYQIILPDGTRVWLNAETTLEYPTLFSNSERRVKLTGEAYFEVAKSKNQQGKTIPFIVSTRSQEIEVLGTQFNIASYEDEQVTKTTLLEGKVKVHVKPNASFGKQTKSIVLKPNQQSTVHADGQLRIVDDVNTEESIAWKNGLFIFDDESLESIMRKISRWYDVDIVFENADPSKTFWGSVSRLKNASEVLSKLELTGSVHFKIENLNNERRIIVME